MIHPLKTIALAAGTGLLALAVGCGSDDRDGAVGTAPTAQPSATTSPSPTEPTPTTSPDLLPAAPALRDDAASGSGCSPGAGDLPTGWWYGTVESPPDRTVRFDLACYYIGSAAEAEAAKRGDEVNNDYYVVNESATTRIVAIDPVARARCVQLGAGVELVDCAVGEVTGDWAVWIRIAPGGAADRILEQYAP